MKTPSWGLAGAIGLLVSSAAVIPWASSTAARTQQFVFEFEMTASKAAVAEVFIDRGAGLEVLTAMSFAVEASAEPRRYVVPLVAGRYRVLRLDPFPDDGALVLQHANIRDRYGRVTAAIDLQRVEPSPFVTISEATPERLVATALPGHGDPRLVYRFSAPLVLWLSRFDLAWFTMLGLVLSALVAALVYPLQRFDRSAMLSLHRSRLFQRPRSAIVLTAAVCTVLSTYPLFFGRSLVTPNNGPLPFVYTAPPYVASSTDTGIEDARAADVQATMWVTLPYVVAQRAALAHGEFPWWNRYSQNGAPLLGQAQTTGFDPLHWLTFFGDLAVSVDMKYVASRLVFVAGVGFASLAATESLAAALLVAGASPFLGHFIGRLNDPIHFSIIYAPWVLVAFGGLVRSATTRQAARAAAGLLLATALLTFASSVKETFALLPALYLAGTVAVLMHAARTSAWRTLAWRLVLVAVAALGAVLLTAPHWLVFFETLASAFTAYDLTAMSFAHVPQALAIVTGALIPGIVYPGLNPLLAMLAVLALLRPRRWWRQPLVAGCTIAASCWLAVAFGAVGESWLVRLPMMSRVHHIGSTFVTAALPLMLIMAASGVTSLTEYAARGERVRAALALAVGAAGTAALAAAADLSNPNTGLALVACLWTGVLCYSLLCASEWASRLRLGVVLVMTAGLLLPSGLHLPTGVALLDAVLMQPRERAPLTTMPDVLMPARSDGDEPTRIAGLNGVLQGGVPTYLGMEGVTGADALFSPYTYWLGKQFEMYFPLQFRANSLRQVTQGPLFDLWGVRWLAVPAASSPDRLALIERPSAWPRAFFVDRVERHDDRAVFLERLRSDTRPVASVLAQDADAANLPPSTPGTGAAVVPGGDYRLTANTTTFTIDAPADGVVVLNEGYWPGVTATVGGRSAPVFRVNETMRGVRVPKGTWQITFGYRPATWGTAVRLSAAGAAIALALWLTPAFGTRRPFAQYAVSCRC